MSLGYIFLCCDDGEIYHCDFIDHGTWKISIEESDADELWVRSTHRPRSQSRNVPRPIVDPQQIISRNGLPIGKLQFISHQNRGPKCKEYAVYAIHWKEGEAFPRRLLPDTALPKQPQNLKEGTYCCYTKQHRAKVAI